MTDGVQCLGDYEAKRLHRIEANQQMLQSLNLRLSPRRTKPAPVRKPLPTVEPVRRSRRVQTLQQQRHVAQAEAHDVPTLRRRQQQRLSVQDRRRRREARQRKRWLIEQEQEFQRALTTDPPPMLYPFVYACQLKRRGATGERQTLPSAVVEIELDSFHSRCLGIQLLPVGKRTVVHALCPSGITTRVSSTQNVMVWKNALTVFAREDCDLVYDNMVTSDEMGVVFDWPGGHEIAPALLQRLLRVERGKEELRLNASYYTSEAVSRTPVLLFLQHATGPYIYCGRIRFLGYERQSATLRWQLVDVASMDWEALHSVLCKSKRHSREWAYRRHWAAAT